MVWARRDFIFTFTVAVVYAIAVAAIMVAPVAEPASPAS